MAVNLIEAINEWINEQPSITELFEGGIYNDDSPPTEGPALPALTFTQGDTRLIKVIGQPPIEFPEVNVVVQAVYAEDARRIAGRVKEILLAGSSLAWLGGKEISRQESDGEGGKLVEGIGPEGGDVWEHRIPLVFCTVRA